MDVITDNCYNFDFEIFAQLNVIRLPSVLYGLSKGKI